MQSVDPRRVRPLNTAAYISGPVVYWMSRDQRIDDNWALLHAQELASKHRTFVIVVFCIRTTFEYATERLVDFMFSGLADLEKRSHTYHIPFVVLLGDPLVEIPKFIHRHTIGAVVCDMNSLRWSRQWKKSLALAVNIPCIEVDAHNIIPIWEVSEKREYAAYTIRSKIHKKLPYFLTEYKSVVKQSNVQFSSTSVDWVSISAAIDVRRDIKKVQWISSGITHANTSMKEFITSRLSLYEKQKNIPSIRGQSQLSPYIHFGQLSTQRIALSIQKADLDAEYSSAYLEELIVRKELADNFCWYTDNYDTSQSFPPWAMKTLNAHIGDIRPYVYSLSQLENASTHDTLWNAAQTELLVTGKMHGYLRMYWAKKILEWTHNPDEAMRFAIYLNDLYSLDGRDSNGYAGIAWSIGGVHDRPWFNRPIFGMIRYMSNVAIQKKVDCAAYLSTYASKG